MIGRFFWRNWRACATAAASLVAVDAQAGAWTLEEDATQLFLQVEYFEADTGFDANGDPANGTYRKLNGAFSTEYGLFDWLTIGSKAEARQTEIDSDGQDAKTYGPAEGGVWARVRFWRGAATVASAQIGYTDASAYDERLRPSLGDGASEIDMRGLIGHGFGAEWGDGWLNAEAAYRLRFEDAADQIRLDLTAGFRPAAAPRLLLMAQSFGTYAAGNGTRSDYDVLKLSPSVGFEITPSVTVQIGVSREVMGRDIEEGQAVFSSLWWTF